MVLNPEQQLTGNLDHKSQVTLVDLNAQLHDLVLQKNRLGSSNYVRKALNLVEGISALQFEKSELIEDIYAEDPDGEYHSFNLNERLEHWRSFYREIGVNWASLPDQIKITKEQAQELTDAIELVGFNAMAIIPANLVDVPKGVLGEQINEAHYAELYKICYGRKFKQSDFDFYDFSDKRQGLRILLYCIDKESTEMEKLISRLWDPMLRDKPKSVANVQETILNPQGLSGLTLSEYLILNTHFRKKMNDTAYWDRGTGTNIASVTLPETYVSGKTNLITCIHFDVAKDRGVIRADFNYRDFLGKNMRLAKYIQL